MDKLSRKIIKYLQKDKQPDEWYYAYGTSDITVLSEKLKVSSQQIIAVAKYLIAEGYLHETTDNKGRASGFRLSHVGMHKREFSRKAFFAYIRDKWIDILALAVAIVALIYSLGTRNLIE